jgi:arginyl-tRNA synthetase
MKELVFGVLKKALKEYLKEYKFKIEDEKLFSIIEIPPNQEMGDYSFPCFFLSPIVKIDAHEIALELREKIGNIEETDFEDIQVEGGYVNFFVNRKSLARQAVWDIITWKKNYGKNNFGKGKKTMVEFASPNTNKPLHLGHLRNLALGESISRILEFSGEKVIRATLNNDRGIHICKAMLAYEKWGREQIPEKKKIKSDHFVGNFYVMFEKKKTKKLEEEAQEMLRKWEAGDRPTLLLWKVITEWALEGFDETYKKFGIKHDEIFFESKLYKRGKDAIFEGIKKKIFEQTKGGEVKVDLTKEGLGEKILLRKDGTALYIITDIALAKMKFDDYKIDKSYYIVGNEQDYHFNVLFSILKKLGLKNKEMKHISYGMVNLPSGRMKSREGTVVDADDLIEDVRVLAAKELKKKSKLSKEELEKRSMAIALAAIKYLLLKIDIRKDMLFNPKESVSFDGDTGSYLMYSYARASSIIRKSGEVGKFEINELTDKELKLSKKLAQFPFVVAGAWKNLDPSLIANYAYQLAQIFNEFYHTNKVLGSKEETFRLALVESTRQVLKNALWLLGIDVLEEM